METASLREFGGCIDSMLCSRSTGPDKAKMHDNVCKAVVEGVAMFRILLTRGGEEYGSSRGQYAICMNLCLLDAVVTADYLRRQISSKSSYRAVRARCPIRKMMIICRRFKLLTFAFYLFAFAQRQMIQSGLFFHHHGTPKYSDRPGRATL